MKLSREQAEGINRINRWRKSGRNQVFRAFGYAGTGKTTIAKHFDGDGVLYAAYTGKAAQVLTLKGCKATTLHSLLYKPTRQVQRELADLWAKVRATRDPEVKHKLMSHIKALDKPGWKLNPDSPLAAAKLLVVDEVSMVNEAMAEDILGFGVKVLVLGDPAQLPPIHGDGYFTDARPDVLLTEVHRNTGAVLEWATRVRNQGAWAKFPKREGTGVLNLPGRRDRVPASKLVKFDQVIVGLNKTRWLYNRTIRAHLGYPSDRPIVGDRVICLENSPSLGVINGEQFDVLDVWGTHPLSMRLRNVDTGAVLKDLPVHPEGFNHSGGKISLPRDAGNFTYGYAITCHKAQGSQWGSVLVVDEAGAMRGDARRWMYTALTRAEDRVVVVRNGWG
ncbi:ATP-dependent DNA helicase [Micromonospora arida]